MSPGMLEALSRIHRNISAQTSTHKATLNALESRGMIERVKDQLGNRYFVLTPKGTRQAITYLRELIDSDPERYCYLSQWVD